jgi:putative FmdB family regulatory protein
MPIYEYQCKGCCHCFEHLTLTTDDDLPACPQCGCPDVEKLMSAGCFRASGIAKGSGGFDSKTACRPSG